MGNKQITSPVNIFCFGNRNKILEEIFPSNDNNTKYEDRWEHRTFKNEIKFKENETGKDLVETIEWNATIYPNITDDNIDELFESLEQNLNIPDEYDEIKDYNIYIDEDSRGRTRNIIIKFGKENAYYLINFMNTITKTHLPQILIITNEDFNEEEEGLDDNRYITIIKENNKNDKDIINDLQNYLWSKECYYNERGNILLSPLPSQKDQINTNNFINIMVTGISRSGKSTLINVLSGKLLTLESPFLESVTNNIREYEILASKNGIFQSGIRLFDTPGLTKIEKTKKDTIKIVKDAMKKKIKECNESKENIHLIYFVLKANTNLENYVDFFKFIIELNEDRIKNGQKKINIIFIINQSTGPTSEESLKEFLLTNHLTELYDKIPIGENKAKPSYKERFSKKVTVQEKREIKTNIISVNILKTKANSNVYGIDLLFKLTYHYLTKDNPFKKDAFEKLNKIKEELNEIDTSENKNIQRRRELQNEANNLFIEISKENSFLSGCSNIVTILEKAKYDSNLIFFYSIFLLSLLRIGFYEDLNTYISLFKKIENCYKIFTDEISIIPIIEKKQLKGFQIIEHLDKNDKNKVNNMLEKSKKKLKNYDGIKIRDLIIYNKDSSINLNEEILKMGFFKKFKYFFFGNAKFEYFKEYLINYFEEYIKKQCCIEYIIRQKTIYNNIFEQIDEMSHKKDWDKFHIQII